MKIFFGLHLEWEKTIRSVVKSITFRVSALISDSLIVLFITKAQAETFSIVLFTNLSSTILYFVHERIWSHIPLWKVKDDDKEVAGYIKQARSFYLAWVRNAGHMVPAEQPRAAFDLIDRFVSA